MTVVVDYLDMSTPIDIDENLGPKMFFDIFKDPRRLSWDSREMRPRGFEPVFVLEQIAKAQGDVLVQRVVQPMLVQPPMEVVAISEPAPNPPPRVPEYKYEPDLEKLPPYTAEQERADTEEFNAAFKGTRRKDRKQGWLRRHWRGAVCSAVLIGLAAYYALGVISWAK